jgi:hypothetical protein
MVTRYVAGRQSLRRRGATGAGARASGVCRVHVPIPCVDTACRAPACAPRLRPPLAPPACAPRLRPPLARIPACALRNAEREFDFELVFSSQHLTLTRSLTRSRSLVGGKREFEFKLVFSQQPPLSRALAPVTAARCAEQRVRIRTLFSLLQNAAPLRSPRTKSEFEFEFARPNAITPACCA